MSTPQPVAVVTGAGSGIGRAVTRALLETGYRVALAGRRDAPMRETGDEASSTPENALVPRPTSRTPKRADAVRPPAVGAHREQLEPLRSRFEGAC